MLKLLTTLLGVGLVLSFAIAAAPSSPTQPEEDIVGLQVEIASLQAQIAAISAACGGDAALAPLQTQLAALFRRLPTDPDRGGGSLDQGGETCADARLISSIPYCNSGNTSTSYDDYSPPASCGASSAPDVVYRYQTSGDGIIGVSLCGSTFDTFLHIWRGCPGQPGSQLVCCNDNSPACGLASCCPQVPVEAGNVYYIVVDGAGTASGDYALHVGPSGICPSQPCPPCSVRCPSNAQPEPETCLGPEVNAGCYGWPVQFTPLACGQTICGHAPWTNSYHDYDAYSVTITQRDSLRWCVAAEFASTISVYQYFSAG